MYFWILSLKKSENEIKEIIPFKMASETVRTNVAKEFQKKKKKRIPKLHSMYNVQNTI